MSDPLVGWDPGVLPSVCLEPPRGAGSSAPAPCRAARGQQGSLCPRPSHRVGGSRDQGGGPRVLALPPPFHLPSVSAPPGATAAGWPRGARLCAGRVCGAGGRGCPQDAGLATHPPPEPHPRASSSLGPSTCRHPRRSSGARRGPRGATLGPGSAAVGCWGSRPLTGAHHSAGLSQLTSVQGLPALGAVLTKSRVETRTLDKAAAGASAALLCLAVPRGPAPRGPWAEPPPARSPRVSAPFPPPTAVAHRFCSFVCVRFSRAHALACLRPGGGRRGRSGQVVLTQVRSAASAGGGGAPRTQRAVPPPCLPPGSREPGAVPAPPLALQTA